MQGQNYSGSQLKAPLYISSWVDPLGFANVALDQCFLQDENKGFPQYWGISNSTGWMYWRSNFNLSGEVYLVLWICESPSIQAVRAARFWGSWFTLYWHALKWCVLFFMYKILSRILKWSYVPESVRNDMSANIERGGHLPLPLTSCDKLKAGKKY